MLKIAFFGTPDFAVPSLKALVERGYEIVGVFTQPDRLAGRGNKTVMPAVKRCALEYGLPVFQFEKIKSAEGVSALRKASPDLMVTAAFGAAPFFGAAFRREVRLHKRSCVAAA